MKYLKKRPFLVYALCIFIVLLPAFHVYFNYPAVEGKTEEHKQKQLIAIGFLSALPFFAVLIFIAYKSNFLQSLKLNKIIMRQ